MNKDMKDLLKNKNSVIRKDEGINDLYYRQSKQMVKDVYVSF